MDAMESLGRLSRIDTLWSVVQKAHAGDAAAAAAQQVLLQRYRGAITRYLRAVLRDPDAADEVFQEFAVAFLRGAFRHADAARGRFRDYVKSALFHLMARHWRRRRRAPAQVDPEVIAQTAAPALDAEFARSWRDEVLARTWQRLAEFEQREGGLFHTVLRWHAGHLAQDSTAAAAALSQELGRPISAAAFRQTLHRARRKFARLLVAEVSDTLHCRDRDTVEKELIELGLHAYCADALQELDASGVAAG